MVQSVKRALNIGLRSFLAIAFAVMLATPLSAQTTNDPLADILDVPGQVWLTGFLEGKDKTDGRRYVGERILKLKVENRAEWPEVFDKLDLLRLEDSVWAWGPFSQAEADQIFAMKKASGALGDTVVARPGSELPLVHSGKARNLTRFGIPAGLDPDFPVLHIGTTCVFEYTRATDDFMRDGDPVVINTKGWTEYYGHLKYMICGGVRRPNESVRTMIKMIDPDTRTGTPFENAADGAVLRVSFRTEFCEYDLKFDGRGMHFVFDVNVVGVACKKRFRDLRSDEITRRLFRLEGALYDAADTYELPVTVKKADGTTLETKYDKKSQFQVFSDTTNRATLQDLCKLKITASYRPAKDAYKISEGRVFRPKHSQTVTEMFLSSDPALPRKTSRSGEIHLVGLSKSITFHRDRNTKDDEPMESEQTSSAYIWGINPAQADRVVDDIKALSALCLTK